MQWFDGYFSSSWEGSWWHLLGQQKTEANGLSYFVVLSAKSQATTGPSQRTTQPFTPGAGTQCVTPLASVTR